MTPDQAIKALQGGEIIALPTETVYGLAGDACNPESISQIYTIKKRPSFNPLIVHIHAINQMQKFAEWHENAAILAEHFWPGALTMVLPKAVQCPLAKNVTAGKNSVAIRMPAHPIMRDILERSGLMLAAPSANPSGKISPTTADHVRQHLPDIPVIDGGACGVGVESTIVDLRNPNSWRVLRPGTISQETLVGILGTPPTQPTQDIIAPGALAKHYAPDTTVALNASTTQTGEGLLTFGNTYPKTAAKTLHLSTTGNLEEAAHNLYEMLHSLDQLQLPKINVMPIPNTGIGIAINDRLQRAAKKD